MFTTNHLQHLYNHTTFCYEKQELLFYRDMALNGQPVLTNQKAIMAQVVGRKVITCACLSVASIFPYLFSFQAWKGISFSIPRANAKQDHVLLQELIK